MHKSGLLCAVAIAALSLYPWAARGGGPTTLPDGAVVDDTAFAIRIELTKMDEAAIKATAAALPSLNPAIPVDRMVGNDTAAMKAGIQTITVVGTITPDNLQAPLIYVGTNANPDEATIKTLIAKMFGLMPKAGEQDKLTMEKSGQFLVVHEKRIALPRIGAPERAKLLEDGLAQAGDNPIAVVFFPDAALRLKMQKINDADTFVGAHALVEDFDTVKWIVLTVKLGAAPALKFTLQADDEAAAREILGHIDDGVVQIEQKIAVQAQQQGILQGVVAAELYTLLHALQPVQKASQLTTSLDAKVFTQLGLMGGEEQAPPAAHPPQPKPGAP